MRIFVIVLLFVAFVGAICWFFNNKEPHKNSVDVFFMSGFSGQSIGLKFNSDIVFVGNMTTDDSNGFTCVISGHSENNIINIEFSWEMEFGKSIEQIEKIDVRKGRFLTVMFSGDESKPFIIDQSKNKPEFY